MIDHVVAAGWGATTAARLASRVRPLESHLVGEGGVCLLGLADDTGVAMNGGRVGAKDGPRAFRAALARLGVAEPMGANGGAGPVLASVFDAGDVVPGATLEETHRRVTAAAREISRRGLFVVGIGGGHDLTFALVRGVIESGRAITRGVYLDAHLDVRGEAGSGMPMRALVEECGVKSLACIGAQQTVNSREHGEWFARHGGRVHENGVLDQPHELARVLRGGDELGASVMAFVSIDLDGIDGAHAPGVSAVNPAGCTGAQAARLARAAGACPSVACFDIMELNPAFDVDGRTARVAAHLFLSFLLGLADRPGRAGDEADAADAEGAGGAA